jgi:hypothetical protein
MPRLFGVLLGKQAVNLDKSFIKYKVPASSAIAKARSDRLNPH